MSALPGGQVERLLHFAARDRLRLEALQLRGSAGFARTERPARRRRTLEQLHALGKAQFRRVVLLIWFISHCKTLISKLNRLIAHSLEINNQNFTVKI